MEVREEFLVEIGLSVTALKHLVQRFEELFGHRPELIHLASNIYHSKRRIAVEELITEMPKIVEGEKLGYDEIMAISYGASLIMKVNECD